MRLFICAVVVATVTTSRYTEAFSHARTERDAPADVATKFENCVSRSGGAAGCVCTVKKDGSTTTVEADETTCKAVQNKKTLNAEYERIHGGLRENCFPRPKGGCRCNEKDENGQDVERKYDTDAQCKINPRVKRGNTLGREAPSQNVRDPVREKAQQNYAAVINELKDKFRGLREGCYPRPKGCLCVIGKNNEGRDITERRMKDTDCKCKANERSADCPAPGA